MRVTPASSVALACGFVLALCGGCASFGPNALERAHGRYNEAVHEVEQEEFLRNLERFTIGLRTPTRSASEEGAQILAGASGWCAARDREPL